MRNPLSDSRALLALTLVLGLLTPGRAGAQQAASSQPVELEPIACFWRTSADAVRIGELFSLVLTCGVLDTQATTVVPDQSKLDPSVLQLQPFEVRGGTQAPEVRTAARRFFQYEYALRYVGEETGKDLQLPALTLTYRVQSHVQQDSAAIESRERQYILPAHTIRVLSLVPAQARDVREAAPVTLAEIDARRFRASALRIAAVALYATAAIVALWGLVRVARGRRTATRVTARHASDAAILGSVARELAEVRRARTGEGWTDVLAARALAALRVGASYQAGLPVPQTPSSDAPLLSGQFEVISGFPVRRRTVVSGAATAVNMAGLRERASARHPVDLERVDALEQALAAFSSAAYGRGSNTASDRLDDALTAADRAVASLRREHSWLATQWRALTRRASDQMRTRGWARS
jgi:hypothetical protein